MCTELLCHLVNWENDCHPWESVIPEWLSPYIFGKFVSKWLCNEEKSLCVIARNLNIPILWLINKCYIVHKLSLNIVLYMFIVMVTVTVINMLKTVVLYAKEKRKYSSRI